MSEPSANVRVSDEERETVAREIRDHFAAGRLDEEELGERLQGVYSAKTAEELQRVRADLPLLPETVAAQERAELVQRRSHLQRRLLQEAGGGMVLFAVCTTVWLASGASGQFWPVWVLLVVLLPLLRNGWRLYGPAPELDRVEEHLDQREQHERRRELRSGGRQQARVERREDRRERRRDRGLP